MSAGSRAGAGAGIPANARRVVQDLKEIVKNSDDEIYAMLKECLMDPNETVQRLLNQDTFHEVKRKRDKNKVSANKESVETRPRASGASPSVQGPKAPDRGNGWGYQNPRYNAELSGGRRRVQSFSGRDNGMSQNVKAPSITTPALPLFSQAKTSMGSSTSNTVGTIISDSIVVANGTVSHTNTPQVACVGGWSTGSGHATTTDVIESTTLQKYATAAPLSSSNTSSVRQLTSSSSSLPPAVYTSSTDSILHPTSEPSKPPTTGLVPSKPDAPVISSSVPESLEALYQTIQTSIDDLSSFSLEAKVKTTDVDATSTSVKVFSEELTASELKSLEVDSSFETLSLSPSATKTMHTGDKYNDRIVYQAPQQPVRSKKGPGPEWKPKSPMRTPQASVAVTRSSPPASPQASMGILSDPTSKVHQISMQDDQHVIIPNHLQVPEAEQTHLNFGSFRDDFSTPISVNLATSEEDNRNSAPIEDNLPGVEPPTEHFIASSFTTSAPVSLDQKYSSQSTVPLMEAFMGGDSVSVSLPAEVVSPVVSRPEELNTAPVFQQSSQYPYLSAGIPNYTSFGIMPQLMGAQYNQEVAESQQQDLSRLPHFMLPLADLGTSYYSPLLRPTTEVEAARYSHFISTNAATKLNQGATLPTGQGVSSSQEGGHTIPQQPVSIQAYPAQHAGIPLASLGANFVGLQYVAPNYGYFPSPYQHSFATNTGYPQAHSVNNYASVGSSPYVATGTATMKYALPQHKPGAAASSTPHALAAAGYGNLLSPVGVATVSAVTTTTASGYDTASGTPFKENNIYIPNQQQGEGSTVWVQTPLSRDVTGIQNNSFYTLLGQGQPTGYAHTQPTHAVPATMAAHNNIYHPSQSSMPPTVHQLLQQSQPGGGVVGGTGRIGVYQQAQHGQLNWTNTY